MANAPQPGLHRPGEAFARSHRRDRVDEIAPPQRFDSEEEAEFMALMKSGDRASAAHQ